MNTHISYWTSRSYLTGVATAQLMWHLSSTNVIKLIRFENFAYVKNYEQTFSNPDPCIRLRLRIFPWKKRPQILIHNLIQSLFESTTWSSVNGLQGVNHFSWCEAMFLSLLLMDATKLLRICHLQLILMRNTQLYSGQRVLVNPVYMVMLFYLPHTPLNMKLKSINSAINCGQTTSSVWGVSCTFHW